jgi:hypothetical protein
MSDSDIADMAHGANNLYSPNYGLVHHHKKPKKRKVKGSNDGKSLVDGDDMTDDLENDPQMSGS